jgi:hypothetical protein
MNDLIPRLNWVIIVLSVLFCTAGGDDYVLLKLDQPAASPFSSIRYEVSRRGRTTAASHRRDLPGHGESLHRMSLLTPEESAAFWAMLESFGISTLKDAGPSTSDAKLNKGLELMGLAWQLEIYRDGKTHRFRVADPLNLEDRRYAGLMLGIIDKVHSIAGEIPFRNVFFPKGKLAWINVISIPVARVYIDGFDTKLETPLYGYELSAGVHEIRLRSQDGVYDRTYEVRVEKKGTTALRVDLR